MTANSSNDTDHSEGVPVESIEYDEYEYKVACKTCGVVESVTLSREDAKGPNPIMDDPAKIHYERTGHTVARLNYTTAPADIREMLDAGEPDDLDWSRIGEWLADSSGAVPA